MKRTTFIIWLWVALTWCTGLDVVGKTHRVRVPDKEELLADSIMKKVIFFAPFYEKIIDDYRAELYIKGRFNIRKKNHILRFVPSMFRIKKGVNEYMMETYSDLHYTAPRNYDQKVKAAIGTASEFWEMDGRLPDFFHINIYSPSLLYDKLLSPLAPNARKYYKYRVDSVMGPEHARSYRVRFMPCNKSFQLVAGYVVVSADVWSVREMRFAGRNEMLRFRNLVKMGDVGEKDEFLPQHYELEGRFKFLGNVVDAIYHAHLRYSDITQHSVSVGLLRSKTKYDLTESYTMRTDTNAQKRDTAYFNKVRPLPLLTHEEQLYDDFFQRRDTLLPHGGKRRRPALQFWGQIGDALISRYSVDLKRVGSVKCSPLINPFLLSYSGSNGISYRQEFKYNRLFSGDRLLRIVPRIGYNFKQKEFYWRVLTDFYYWPSRRAALHVDVGRGNRIYSSEVLDDLKAIPDSIFDFSQIHLDYFDDYYIKLRHTWEVINGLTLDIGLSMHRRTEVNRSRFVLLDPTLPGGGVAPTIDGSNLNPPNFDVSLLSKFRHAYNSFAPGMKLTYTPGQYYYMDGKRKVNLYSRYPSMSVEWERGIGGVLANSSTYERIEVDAQQHIPLGLMRNFYWRAGWGAFTNQRELYFVDFANLHRSNLPTGWHEDISGVFQLLDGRWYNSSRQYVRGHATLEVPFLIMPHLAKYTRFVLNERIYLNVLTVPHLKPYIEIGYGIGTHVFDFGLFGSFANWGFQKIGCKFTFELFNR